MKYFTTLSCLTIVALIFSSFSTYPTEEGNPCDDFVFVSDFVIAQDISIEAGIELTSSQTIAQFSDVIYRSGGSVVMTATSLSGSLTGPSPLFQVFPGSTLTVELEDCN